MPRHLALSTNSIEKISSLSGMDNLQILSLGRNLLKKIENVEVVAETLEELWLSYNQIEKLVSCPADHAHTLKNRLCCNCDQGQRRTTDSPDPPPGLQSGVEKLGQLRVLYLSNNKVRRL